MGACRTTFIASIHKFEEAPVFIEQAIGQFVDDGEF